MILEQLADAATDSARLLPFLFLAFCLLELLEKHSDKLNSHVLLRFRSAGPILGALLGCIPECGIPVLAINLFAGALISPGTVMAVLLSTSDEALLLLIGSAGNGTLIFKILVIKFIAATIFGYAIDLFGKNFLSPKPAMTVPSGIHDDCCEKGVLRAAFHHTVELFTYLFIFTFCLNMLLALVGLPRLAAFLLKGNFLQPCLTALLGLIPNCAASILLIRLYLQNVLSFPALLSGLCTCSGVGYIVLYKVNTSQKQNAKMILLLYVTAIAVGFLFSMI